MSPENTRVAFDGWYMPPWKATRSSREIDGIDPGVPETQSLGDDKPLAVVLKSGNFGSEDFFDKALKHLDGAAA